LPVKLGYLQRELRARVGLRACAYSRESPVGMREHVLVRIARGHGDSHAAHAQLDQGADLEQFQANRAHGGVGQFGARKCKLA